MKHYAEVPRWQMHRIMRAIALRKLYEQAHPHRAALEELGELLTDLLLGAWRR